MKNTSSKDYNTLEIFQLLAKVVSSQSVSLQQGFLQNFEILKYTRKLHLHLYPFPPVNNTIHGPLRLLKLDLHSATHIIKNAISYRLHLEPRRARGRSECFV